MNSKNLGFMWFVVVALFVVIVVLAYFLVTMAAPSDTATDTQSGVPAPGTPLVTDENSSPVTVTAPKSGANVPKTFVVTGSAPGTWYFEASFGVKVLDANNNVLVSTYATALSDWMTTAQVPFKADVTVTGYTGPATLVLSKDNPSGLPENDASISMPITIQ